MKNLMSFAVLFSFLFIFTNCKKEEVKIESPPLLFSAHDGYWKPKDAPCEENGFFCRPSSTALSSDELEKLELVPGEIAGSGILVQGFNEDVLKFNFTRNNLTQERVNQLIEEKVIEVVDHEFNPELVKDLYEQAGVEYHGKPLMITGGLYEVETNGTGTPMTSEIDIDIDITYKDGTVTVKITISW